MKVSEFASAVAHKDLASVATPKEMEASGGLDLPSMGSCDGKSKRKSASDYDRLLRNRNLNVGQDHIKL